MLQLDDVMYSEPYSALPCPLHVCYAWHNDCKLCLLELSFHFCILVVALIQDLDLLCVHFFTQPVCKSGDSVKFMMVFCTLTIKLACHARINECKTTGLKVWQKTSWCKMASSAVSGRETRLGMLLPSACGADWAGMQRVLLLSHLHVL